ncbi:MAG: hypothetical protein QM696_08660 [Steroidobacteraceae bacterium]
MNDLRRRVLLAQIENAQRSKDPQRPNSWIEYELSKQDSGFAEYLKNRSMGTRAEPPASIQEHDRVKEEYAARGKPAPSFEEWLRMSASMTPINPTVGMLGGGLTVIQPTRGGGVGLTPLSTPQQEVDAAAALKAAIEKAAKEGQLKGERQATFNSDIAQIDDEIARTERLLGEFNAGKYQTGPLAGMLPNWRTAAQDLQREQGKDVIKAISSATFGALSEGERKFLSDLGISEKANEESNINLLKQRSEALRKARERLIRQNQGDSGGAISRGASGGWSIEQVN